MPASSYARNPAREALDSLLEPSPFPLRLWLAFFFFFFVLALIPAALPRFPHPPIWALVSSPDITAAQEYGTC